NALASGDSQTLNHSINTAALSVGQHTLYFNADTWSDRDNGEETNNLNSFTFTVSASKTDLVVDSITPAATTVIQGATLAFSYVVKDIGAGDAGASYTAFAIDQTPDTTHFAGYNVTNALAAGASQTLNHSISTAGLSLGQHTLYFNADTW